MADIERIVRDVLHDPWVSRVFLAFTVGLFLSCSAEFAARQAPDESSIHSALPVNLRIHPSSRDMMELPL